MVIASSLGYFFFSGIRGFAIIYFPGHYGVSRSVLTALAVIIGIGALAGVLFSGRLTRRLLDRGHVRSRILVPGVSLLIAALIMAGAFVTTSPFIGIPLLTFGAAALAMANPPIDAARLDIVPPFLWGRGEAGRMVIRNTFEGGALILFGALSRWLGGGQQGLEISYLLMLIPLVVASSLAIPAYFSYPHDIATATASAECAKDARHGET